MFTLKMNFSKFNLDRARYLTDQRVLLQKAILGALDRFAEAAAEKIPTWYASSRGALRADVKIDGVVFRRAVGNGISVRPSGHARGSVAAWIDKLRGERENWETGRRRSRYSVQITKSAIHVSFNTDAIGFLIGENYGFPLYSSKKWGVTQVWFPRAVRVGQTTPWHSMQVGQAAFRRSLGARLQAKKLKLHDYLTSTRVIAGRSKTTQR